MDFLRPIKLIGFTALTLFSSGLLAETVTLKSLDGTLSIAGDLVNYDSDIYTIDTNIGRLSIAADEVECEGDACPALMPKYSEFTISGSRELALNLMPNLLDGFAESLGLQVSEQAAADGNSEMLFTADNGTDVAKITFIMKGSSTGMRDLVSGAASLAITTRQARPAEASAFTRAGLGDFSTPGIESVLALDGLVVVTSNQNKVHIIKNADLAQIFAGKISNWADLGGIDAPINLYVRPENSATGALFTQLIMRPARTGFSLRVNVMSSEDAVAEAVAADPNGIGFTSYADVQNARPVSLLGSCGIQSPASDFTIAQEEYPYSRRMYIYKRADDVPMVNMFIDYLGTHEAQDLIARTGYVGQDVNEVPVNDQGLRFLSAALPSDAEMTLEQLQAMMVDLSTAQRLSITYRFEQGTSQLDSRGQADIQRLVEQVKNGTLANKDIILLGFTDSVGTASVNESLSLSRAEQVRNAILAAADGQIDPVRIIAHGYGELSPLGCNADVEGRKINRRVEVWIR